MDEIEKYLQAGKIAARVREKGRQLVRPGKKALEIAEELEKMITDSGAGIAFPVNISVNENAAHYTPSHDDDLVIGEKDVVKVDVGVHVDGYIADTAITVDLSQENQGLVEASRLALENAIAAAKAGVSVGELGEIIGKTITEKGFKPVSNLTGHLLGRYVLHAGLSIPNVKTNDNRKLEEGMAVAIEPFASTGEGIVKEGAVTEVFMLQAVVPVRGRHARRIMETVAKEYKTLPFAERWLYGKGMTGFQIRIGLKELVETGALRPYPVLHDVRGSLVSQAEHTIIIEKDSCKVITR